MARTKKRVVNELEFMYGKEPTWDKVKVTDSNYQHHLGKALNWYNIVPSATDKKNWLIEWCAVRGMNTSALKTVNENILGSVGSAARIASRGFPLNEKNVKYIIDYVQSLTGEVAKSEPVKKVVKKSDADPTITAALDVIDPLIDSVFSGATKWELPDFSALKLNGVQTTEIKTYVASIAAEIELADSDEDYAEAYSQGKRLLNRVVKLCNEINEALGNTLVLTKASKKPRAPRKKRFVPASKHVSKLNYMKSDDKLGIASINPEKIIGASTLLVYNTKLRRLCVYNADDEAKGLQCKGSTLQNFNADQSIGKTLRKPEEQLVQFLKGTKSKVAKEFIAIRSAEKALTGRINNDCILLRIL